MHCRPLQRTCYTESGMNLITVWMCVVWPRVHTHWRIVINAWETWTVAARCTLCPCKMRNKFLVNFWNRTILLCILCICTYIQYIYISVQYTYFYIEYIYLFLKQRKSKQLTFVVFGTVHSDRTVVGLRHKHTLYKIFGANVLQTLSTCFNSAALSPVVRMLLWAGLTLWHMSTVRSTFSSRLISLISLQYTSCLSPIFHVNCSQWCRFTFLTHFVKKIQCCWRGN